MSAAPPTSDEATSPLLGVVGGMGPLTSAEFLRTFYARYPGRREQELPRCVLLSDPTFPDRTEAFKAGGGPEEELLRRLQAALEQLASLGAARLMIACVTIHYLVPALPAGLREQLISLIDVAVEDALAAPGQYLLLCTTGTRELGLFSGHPRWPELAPRVKYLPPEAQAELHRRIYQLKANLNQTATASWVEDQARRQGAEAVILGCTDLHLLHSHLGAARLPVLDPLERVAAGWPQRWLPGAGG